MLAIDPSSPFTGGAILGDRVRMQDHATDPGVFIRSMATRGHLGGLALATPRGRSGCSTPSAGRWVLVETVGVGQVEVEIAGKADTTVVVVNPGWGDAVQANKAGLMEIADVFVINKADRPGVDETRRDLEQMLDLSDLGDGWRPPIVADGGPPGRGGRGAVGRRQPTTGPTPRRHGRARAAPRARGCARSWSRSWRARLDARARELCSGEAYERAARPTCWPGAIDPWARRRRDARRPRRLSRSGDRSRGPAGHAIGCRS